ncbi:MAG: HAMP domain-containing histidine kinase [Chloroflexi bacterium]|nr:HAMP domain-containing histidine kinase [Chloroflexota bacterium]
MLRTLRQRFILSHVLPLLVLIPIMGIALIYTLETQIVLANLSGELAGQAVLIAELAAAQPNLWDDPAEAQKFVDRISSRVKARLMLLDRSGRLLASSDPADTESLGQPIDLPGLSDVLSGEINVRTSYSRHLRAEIADVLVPVPGPDQQVVGAIRLTYHLASVYERFLRMRSLVVMVLAAGLLLGAIIGWILALNLERPLRNVTQAVYQLAAGQRTTPLPEQGPQEIRLLVHAFNTLVERLRTLEEIRHRLLSNLIHELGRPLGALHSAIQALLRGADQDPALRHDLLTGMEGELNHLQRLLDDLALLHDQVVGTLELDRRPIALSEWLPQALSPWKAAAQEKGLRWEDRMPAELPVVEADPDRLAQALGNLLSNAIKYTPPGGTIAVHSGVEDGSIWIRVSDTGPGIPPEELEHIFTPFYRSHTHARFPQGMGLGLSIARDLITAHGGRLEVDSAPGQGSRFTLWLPLSPAEDTPDDDQTPT